ncbi:MAG: hypothetical protein WC867_06745 [Candidatus Pacearchaeota archaeon]|jgi:hypothetical protein
MTEITRYLSSNNEEMWITDNSGAFLVYPYQQFEDIINNAKFNFVHDESYFKAIDKLVSIHYLTSSFNRKRKLNIDFKFPSSTVSFDSFFIPNVHYGVPTENLYFAFDGEEELIDRDEYAAMEHAFDFADKLLLKVSKLPEIKKQRRLNRGRDLLKSSSLSDKLQSSEIIQDLAGRFVSVFDYIL